MARMQIVIPGNRWETAHDATRQVGEAARRDALSGVGGFGPPARQEPPRRDANQKPLLVRLLCSAEVLGRKRAQEAIGELHRTKPDRDNIDKAVLDALFDEDSAIAAGYLENAGTLKAGWLSRLSFKRLTARSAAMASKTRQSWADAPRVFIAPSVPKMCRAKPGDRSQRGERRRSRTRRTICRDCGQKVFVVAEFPEFGKEGEGEC